ncbi:hypothetical protein DSM100685_0365 [Bifidobacterium avesanii]|nr:hypothetical protein DSM100685_0365 [Bifidobacterium avesanii]
MTPSPCEQSLADAEDARAGAFAGANPSYVRYREAARAAVLWRDAAVACPGRFAEGVLESGRMSHRAAQLAGRLRVEYSSPADRTTIDEHTEVKLSAAQAAGLALAQDRAGFAMEILSAKLKSDPTLLTLSDRHKALGSGFAAHASSGDAGSDGSGNGNGNGSSDTRQKVYSVQRLLTDPSTTVDDANGLRASTSAVVEMDAVREQLQALAGDGENGSGSDGDIVISDASTATTLAALLSEEAAQAFALGYPTYDAALFTGAAGVVGSVDAAGAAGASGVQAR